MCMRTQKSVIWSYFLFITEITSHSDSGGLFRSYSINRKLTLCWGYWRRCLKAMCTKAKNQYKLHDLDYVPHQWQGTGVPRSRCPLHRWQSIEYYLFQSSYRPALYGDGRPAMNKLLAYGYQSEWKPARDQWYSQCQASKSSQVLAMLQQNFLWLH